MANEDNEQQLIDVMGKVWSDDTFAAKFRGRSVIFVSNGVATEFSSIDGKTAVKNGIASLASM